MIESEKRKKKQFKEKIIVCECVCVWEEKDMVICNMKVNFKKLKFKNSNV